MIHTIADDRPGRGDSATVTERHARMVQAVKDGYNTAKLIGEYFGWNPVVASARLNYAGDKGLIVAAPVKGGQAKVWRAA